MGKKALVTTLAAVSAQLSIEEGKLYSAPISPDFFNLPLSMADRDTCETDESLLQIIPYVVLHCADRIFTYARGSAGEETRLHARLSVGLGGHVDGLPPEGTDLEAWLKAEAIRELQEEVGFTAVPEMIKFTHLLIDRTEPTGRVHLGVLTLVEVADPAELTNMEANVIQNGAWEFVHDISAHLFRRLENWSRQAVAVIRANATGPIREAYSVFDGRSTQPMHVQQAIAARSRFDEHPSLSAQKKLEAHKAKSREQQTARPLAEAPVATSAAPVSKMPSDYSSASESSDAD